VVVKYGYFADEEVSAKIDSIRANVVIVVYKPERPRRSVNQVSLGCHDPGVSLPMPARNDCYSQLLGVCKRIVPELPIPTILDEEMFCFADRFFDLYFRPLHVTEVCTPEEWLATRRFCQSRRDQYAQRWEESDFGRELDFDSKGFEKEETYVEFKFPRNIQPLDLAVNMYKGPVDIAIEAQVFRLPCFIKKVPEHLRVQHLACQVAGLAMLVVYTDYTSMEAALEGRKFEWHQHIEKRFVCDLPQRDRYLHVVRMTTVGTYDDATGEGRAPSVRMPTLTVKNARNLRSGDTKTSRVNAQQNCINRYFILQKWFGIDCLSRHAEYVQPLFVANVPESPGFTPPGIMEGDDGEFMEEKWAMTGTHHYAALGYKCEPQHGVFGLDGDFLSVYYDHIDLEMLTDIRAVYADLGWGNSDYIVAGTRKKMELLRAKALSQLHRLPACPVVTAQALHVLRATKSIVLDRFFQRRHRSVSTYELDQMYAAYEWFRIHPIAGRPIGDRSRVLVEKYTGVTVDMQLRIESVFNSTDELKPRALMDPMVCPAAWGVTAIDYVRGVTLDQLRTRTDVPPPLAPKFANFTSGFWEKFGSCVTRLDGAEGEAVFVERVSSRPEENVGMGRASWKKPCWVVSVKTPREGRIAATGDVPPPREAVCHGLSRSVVEDLIPIGRECGGETIYPPAVAVCGVNRQQIDDFPTLEPNSFQVLTNTDDYKNPWITKTNQQVEEEEKIRKTVEVKSAASTVKWLDTLHEHVQNHKRASSVEASNMSPVTVLVDGDHTWLLKSGILPKLQSNLSSRRLFIKARL
jgi:hypothetical protein